MAFQYQVLLSILLIHATNALQCTICLDYGTCNSQPAAQECNADLVSDHHRYLDHINPSLASAAPSTTFKCYDLDLFYRSTLTGSLVLVVQKGCTYSTTNFCEGWRDDVEMTHCAMCESGDACNNVPVQTTTTTVPTTTTTADPASTTTTVVSSTTTVSVAPTSTTTAIPATTTTATTADPASTTTTSVSSTSTASVAPTSTTTVRPVTTTTSTSTVLPVTTTTSTSASTSTTTSATTTTPKPASAGCVTMSWMLVVGFVLLHGLVS